MTAPGHREGPAGDSRPPRAPGIRVLVLRGQVIETERRFTGSFVIGRHAESDLCLPDTCVSRRHAEVLFDGDGWCVRDLQSRNGTWVNGQRVQVARLPEDAELELGAGGPILRLLPDPPPSAADDPSARPAPESVTEIIEHYFRKKGQGPAGEHTRLFQRAFQRAHRRKARKYWVAVGVAVLLLAVAGGIIAFQRAKLARLRATAESIFYAMKGLELQIAQLEDAASATADPKLRAEVGSRRLELEKMAGEYDRFLDELDVYGDLPLERRIIFRMARRFGECELAMPKDFADEVLRYVGLWRTTDRLATALGRARRNGYPGEIARAMDDQDLPPHFFFLALQESDFKERVVGPKTRYGFAKGIWQFIPATADRYGLKVGPLYQRGVYDPADERYDFAKATRAAAAYLRDINGTEAQASGLLVLASYNWGENNVRKIIRSMPENPKDRNFWRLLDHRDVPRETYDYVFSIFSAAVICQNPRLFGFDLECPDLNPS